MARGRRSIDAGGCGCTPGIAATLARAARCDRARVCPLAIHNNDFDAASLGGVTIHGMISHTLLERYVWTIDFKNHTYRFSK
jgi:hypothetical protein